MACDDQKPGFGHINSIFRYTIGMERAPSKILNASIYSHSNHLGGVRVSLWRSYKNLKGKNIESQKILQPSIDTNRSFTHHSTMTTPSNASALAVSLRDKALSTFNNYKVIKDTDESEDAPVILLLAAKYCVRVLYIFHLPRK
ncbi:MAG: hypothetical protein NVS9B9_29650 [Ktedonobacteraceae bacterium]